MAENLTPQQKQAVTDRGGNLLVSAAAGSGKTKVLVDRLISYLSDPVKPENLDSFLIITYTKAAAAELRGKIAAKISERIAEDPENRHLQQQMQRLYLTKISTVHAFCTDILREYANQLDIPADFRVADENEVLELQSRAIDQILDEAYENADSDPDFCAFVDSQGFGRDDSNIPEIILKVYNSANCHLDPASWLEQCTVIGEDLAEDDAAKTPWGQYLVIDLQNYVSLQIDALTRCIQLAHNAEGMEKPAALLETTVDQLSVLTSCKTWDDIIENKQIDYGRLTFSKKVTDHVLADKIKAIRENCKKGLAKRLRRFSDGSEQVISDLQDSMAAVRGLIALTKDFKRVYDSMKKRRRILDFSDLEHKTLDLLLGKSRSGATVVAHELSERFCEVMVDEYQDSNAVQDAIFNVLTYRRKNCFMVGDVKQSIYQFRLADPGIFLEKYHSFLPAEEAVNGQDRKVILSKNFRSAGQVIEAVNDVFSTCMSPEVGGLYYGDEEYLYESVAHIPAKEQEVELFCVDVQEDTYAEEAAFVAQKVCELLDGTHFVRQEDQFRPIKPEDIVILLRSPGSVGYEFQQAIERCGIRCSTESGSNLLLSEEIETLRALLNVICNPLQDIPLIAVLTSRIFGFTADELASIRCNRRNVPLYEALLLDKTAKAAHFVEVLSELRQESRLSNLSRLVLRIISLTRIDTVYSSMTDGALRMENLQNFCQIVDAYESNSCGGLSQFLSHLDLLEQRGVAASGPQKGTEAVTIMSIHKSKGLEFPVVFLCGLSREFNRESLRAPVLCDNTLGLGVVCVDAKNRVRYPTVAKRAIAAKMSSESLSEEMRVLYVAMTRARDRLIMTYAQRNVADELLDISMRMDLSNPLLLTGAADCPGTWVLMTALKQRKKYWEIKTVRSDIAQINELTSQEETKPKPEIPLEHIRQMLSYRYGHIRSTQVPSKLTATQMKGRAKDREVAENTAPAKQPSFRWRDPEPNTPMTSGVNYGNTIHSIMCHLHYENCFDRSGVEKELVRMKEEGILSEDQLSAVRVDHILAFFQTELGRKLQQADHVLREFKFSVLEDAGRYYDDVDGEKILLQGVVDCAIIEEDGITVLDFKTDRVTEETIAAVAQGYAGQVRAYAHALEKIYKKPVKSAQLYFFCMDQFVQV